MTNRSSSSRSSHRPRTWWVCLLITCLSLLVLPLVRQHDTVYAALLPDKPPLFSDYNTWYKSTLRDTNNGTHELLQSMARYTFPPGSLMHSTPQKYSFIDINGDGLTDFLFHATYIHSSWESYFALMINNGNNDFDLIYECVRDADYYYGSCALGATPINEPNMLTEIGYLISYSYGFNVSGETGDSKYKHVSASVDINGDGLVDLITNQSWTGYRALINQGNLGFEIVQ